MKRKSQAGQALILTAIALSALMGFAGLAVDMGVMRYEKRLQQTAADAAALAGASDLSYGGVTAGAQNAAAANGFTDNGGGNVSACTTSAAVNTVCVQINNPPTSGPHSGNGNYVEALVADVHTTYFMKILGISKTVITARAVATNISGGSNDACLYTLGPPTSSIEGVNINGSAVLNAPTCGIDDNGDFNTKGNALTVQASTFGISGDANQSGPGGSVTCTTPGPCPSSGMPAVTDPLAGLPPPPCSPSAPGCTGGNTITINGSGNPNCGTGCTYSGGTYTVSPGQYDSITIKGVASDQVVFSPGIYVIDGSGGLAIPGNATISGDGVMFYFTGTATINMTGTPSMDLIAPSSGTYQGILMYQDPTDTNTNGPSLGGNTGSTYQGVLYFPNDNLTFYGNNNTLSTGIVITSSLSLSGNPTVNLEGNAGLPPGVSLTLTATLVE